tara:strand:- start:561 stop:872 length:312 start_codon:yes stop_codon:yes gene_type:complete
MTKKIEKTIVGIIIGLLHIYLFFGFKIISKSNINYHINFIIHWHHWLICLIVFCFLLIITKIKKYKKLKKLKKYKYYLSGYLITMIIHGLLYEDRFDFKIIGK